MRPLDYLHLQMRLEGMEVIDECLLRQVQVVPGEDVPMLLIAQPVDARVVVYYEEAISSDLQQSLSVHVPEIEFPQIDRLLEASKSHHIDTQVGHYKTYIFPSPPENQFDVISLSKNDASVKAFGFDRFAESVYAIHKDGAVISACVSARENEQCGEAWVYTSPEHRHQGLAQKVVSTWAKRLIDAGKVPFYSHKIENTASANLAAKLGLQPVFEEIVISPQV